MCTITIYKLYRRTCCCLLIFLLVHRHPKSGTWIVIHNFCVAAPAVRRAFHFPTSTIELPCCSCLLDVFFYKLRMHSCLPASPNFLSWNLIWRRKAEKANKSGGLSAHNKCIAFTPAEMNARLLYFINSFMRLEKSLNSIAIANAFFHTRSQQDSFSTTNMRVVKTHFENWPPVTSNKIRFVGFFSVVGL